MRKLAALALALSSLALFAERDMAIYRGKLTSDLNANGNRITSVDLPLDAGDAANKEYVDAHGGGIDTNAVDILANSAVVTNALIVATTNRVAALETAMDEKANSADIPGMVKETMSAEGISRSYINIGGSISGQTVSDQTGDLRVAINGKADKTIPSANGNLAALTSDGNLSDSGKKANDFAPAVEGGYLPIVNNWLYFDSYDNTMIMGRLRFSNSLKEIFSTPEGLVYSEFAPVGPEKEIAVKGDISAAISATNPTFSNAVLAVGLNIDTNSVAVLNEISATFGGFPIEGTATTVGGLLAALAAAVAWLKKNKVGSFASVGGATATVENGVAKLDDFFTESNSLLTGRVNTLIDAKVGDVNAVLAAALDGTELA